MGDGRSRPLAEGSYQLGFDILGSVRAITRDTYILPYGNNPVFHQAFEQALKETPEEIRKQFNFSDLRIGRRCIELPDLISVGHASLLLETTQIGYQFKISHWNGLDIVREMRNKDPKRSEAIQSLAKRLVSYLQGSN